MGELDGARPADPERVAMEREWLRRLAQGGPGADAAMHALFRRYQAPFKAFLRSRGFRGPEIDDLTQRVWLDVARKSHTFLADGVPEVWLWGFLKTAMRDALRAGAQRGARFVSSDDDNQAPSIDLALSELASPSPEAARAVHDFRECVRRAFAVFKRQHPKEAWWLYLWHVEEWDLEQIARYRGSTLHAASQFLSKARKMFREPVAPCLELRPD
ncbi:MAG: sigma-70 family RNA polymerase sigma factor [Rubrivivax sp.]|nr:sigma-70 family RNA polymerase sigma factor [Rubrivivax sp.]